MKPSNNRPPPSFQRKYGAMWSVTVPTELKRKFKEQYPGRAAMRKLTILALQWAIRRRPPL